MTSHATLADDLILLATGTEGAHDSTVDVALAGAQLMELDLLGRIDVVDDRVVVLDSASTGRADLDDVLERIHDRRPRKADDWIRSLADKVREPVLEHLVATGAIIEERRKVLGLFPSTDHALADPGDAATVGERVTAALRDGAAERDVALLAVVEAAGLLESVAPGVDAEVVQARLNEITDADRAGAGARHVIGALRFAVQAVVASTATTTGVVTTNSLLLGNN